MDHCILMGGAIGNFPYEKINVYKNYLGIDIISTRISLSEQEYEEMAPEDMGTLCGLLQEKKAPDMQVFCNACLSNKTLAPFMSSLLPSTIIIGADRSILTGHVLHAFKVDALHNRLYFSVNVINLNLCELYANIKDARVKPLINQDVVEPEIAAGSSSSTAIEIDLFLNTKHAF